MKSKICFKTLKVGYSEERKIYSLFYGKELDADDCQLIVDKLVRHFKLPRIRVSFHGYPISRAYKFGHVIKLSTKHGLNFGTLCHEVNHFLCWKIQDENHSDRIRHGTKIWNRNLQRILRYCYCKNFWEEELTKRSQPKPDKPEPTKEELKQVKIVNLQMKIKRYNTKLKLYNNKLKKAERKINYLLR